MTRFGDFPVATALPVCAVVCLPLLVLLWYWWGLEGLKKLPENVARMAGNASDEVRSHIQSVRAGESKKRFRMISLGKLWELRSLADEAGELLGVDTGQLAIHDKSKWSDAEFQYFEKDYLG